MNFADFEQDGFAIFANVLNDATLAHLREALASVAPSGAVSRRREAIYGVRNLLEIVPEVRAFSESDAIRRIAAGIIGERAKVVRAIFFDKTPAANWKVPWHQDLTIAVREKRAARGFTTWTTKAGISHVQPPVEILEKMVTLRFHLDDADASNGALKIIPRTHLAGRLGAAEIKSRREANETLVCSVKKGDCLIMRPLILHSSSAATNPRRRRVVHLEFAAHGLPGGLDWYGS